MLVSRKYLRSSEPYKDAKKIYIFCEGKKREYQYFRYFINLDSRINIIPHELKGEEDNSPLGLMSIAQNSILKTETNSNPIYQFIEGDEVWLVFDSDKDKTDSRKIPIQEVREECKKHNWFVAQSNPCFEVWLYYHFFSEKPFFENSEICDSWKQHISNQFGGFNSNKHPLFIHSAIQNAENQYSEDNEIPDVACTQVFKLAKVFYPFIKNNLSTKKVID